MEAGRRPLSLEEAEQRLGALVGSRVSVRVVERTQPERLIAVLEGVLGEPTDEKTPSRFWPIESGLPDRPRAAERLGIVLHREAFTGAEERAGGELVVIAQGAVIVNVRRL